MRRACCFGTTLPKQRFAVLASSCGSVAASVAWGGGSRRHFGRGPAEVTAGVCSGSDGPPLSFSRRAVSQQARESTSGHTSGVVEVTQKNIRQEVDETNVPVLLYFHITNNPDVVEYTKLLVHHVVTANRRHRNTTDYSLTNPDVSKDSGLAVKLCLVDCQKEKLIAEKYLVNAHQFPMILFCRKRASLDRLHGIVAEAQVKEAVDAFIEFCEGKAKDEREGKSDLPEEIREKIKRADNDDENTMTLLTTAHQKLRVKELAKAEELYTKALKLATEGTERIMNDLGFGRKKETDEMWKKLRRDGHYNAKSQAMAGLAMTYMAKRQPDRALAMAGKIRHEFPYATNDLRDVAQAVTRIEMAVISGFDLDKDNYVTLLKFEHIHNDPVEFYNAHVKIAIAHFFDKKFRAAIIECVKLIRAEPKLLPALKAGGVLPADFVLSRTAVTPARRVAALVLESLGPSHETVLEGRKMLDPYL